MSMYTIYRMQDGTYHCEGRLQDGTERWISSSLESAIESMKKFAKTMNGTKLKKKGIVFFEPVEPIWKEFRP